MYRKLLLLLGLGCWLLLPGSAAALSDPVPQIGAVLLYEDFNAAFADAHQRPAGMVGVVTGGRPTDHDADRFG